MRNIHNHYHHLPNNWSGAKLFNDWMSLLSFYQLIISSRTNAIAGYFQYFPEELKIPGDFQYFQEL